MKGKIKKDYQFECIKGIVFCITIWIIIFSMMLCYKVVAYAAVYYVPNNYKTIRAAIDAAVDGDTIIVRSGTYTGEDNRNLNFKGKRITVKSENGAENTIIDCQDAGRGFTFNSGETYLSVLDGFTIKNGIASFSGGGIACSHSSPTIKNCIITDNRSQELEFGQGGGILCYDSSSPRIINCVISRNKAQTGSGIMCYKFSSPIITNCMIIYNLASYWSYPYANAITCLYSSSPIITNCIITQNGGGIYSHYESSPTIINCIISDNGSGIKYSDGPITITNSIIWNNEIICRSETCDITIIYSDIEGGWEGEGNIDLDPRFVDPSNNNYHLRSSSPCIDAGTSLGAPNTDIEGNRRPCHEYDMGAYEFIIARDSDEDGHYSRGSCVSPNDDCDDHDSSTYPDAPEQCDGEDNNCDGRLPVNEKDIDKDGWMSCNGECNDSDSSIYPGAPEQCDGKDNDCDSQIDEGLSTDGDGDGHYTIGSCLTPADDPDDSDASIYPAAPEQCDGKDNDCDSQIDEGLSTDGDGDGHYTLSSCQTPADDCDDNNPEIWECNTPVGEDVTIPNDTGKVTVTFPSVAGGGNTIINAEECETPPEGLTLAPYHPMCVEITTDASFEGEVQICISYDDQGLTISQELNIKMVHCDDQGNCGFIPCDPPINVDTVNNIVCGCSSHFSIFAIGIPKDSDGDLTPDLLDNCPDNYNIWQEDTDKDGIGDTCDNCPDFYDSTNQCKGLQMSLPANWSMISLPVVPENLTSSILFPEAILIYGYQKGIGYKRIEDNDPLEPGKGYWILLPEAKTYSFFGQSIKEYPMTIDDDWFMIGGCTFTAKATLKVGEIEVIYSYVQGVGYQRIYDFSNIVPGKGYCILFKNTNEQSEFRVTTQF